MLRQEKGYKIPKENIWKSNQELSGIVLLLLSIQCVFRILHKICHPQVVYQESQTFSMTSFHFLKAV